MTTPATNFKLGIFAIAAVASSVAAVLALGLRTGRGQAVELHTLFDESVQGLEVGAPVKYLGVKVGNVARIEITRDRSHVDVALAIDERASSRLDLAHSATVFAQLSSQGLTGVKFVDLGVDAAPDANRDPRFLPSKPSLGRQLELQATRLATTLPDLLDDTRATLHRFDALIDDVRDRRVIDRAVATLDDARAAIGDARRLVPRAARAIDSANQLAGNADRAVATANDVLATIKNTDLAASARRASDAVTALGRRLLESTGDLEQTIRDVGEAARTLRELVEDVSRDPDMLVKGRARASGP